MKHKPIKKINCIICSVCRIVLSDENKDEECKGKKGKA